MTYFSWSYYVKYDTFVFDISSLFTFPTTGLKVIQNNLDFDFIVPEWYPTII